MDYADNGNYSDKPPHCPIGDGPRDNAARCLPRRRDGLGYRVVRVLRDTARRRRPNSTAAVRPARR